VNAGSPPRPAVFLDRDGTINREVDFLSDPTELELLPGAAQAIARLNEAEWAVVVVTNQSGIARGFLDEERLAEIHGALETLLEMEGAKLDAIYFCPHHPTVGEDPYRLDCSCRKPAPGMILRAAVELGLDLRASWIVGDSLRDLDAGAAAGVRGILVGTGKKESLEEESEGRRGARDLNEAVEIVLG
jgi:D-glycero-D-manno-heptose 1,7-bisphosphate phosphatase